MVEARETRSAEFGEWQVHIVDCGSLALDGGAMFGSVPRVLWEKMIPPDARHRIPLVMRLLLLRHASDERNVLIDVGIGNKFDDRFQQMFDIHLPVENAPNSLEAALSRHGVGIADITDVILTHMHFDHGGGVSVRVGAEVAPQFPKATHYLQAANLETAQKPNLRERASYLSENVAPLGDVDLRLLDGEEEVLKGVSVIPSHGHTAGMQLVRLEGSGRVLYYAADLAPTHHHLRVPFTMGYDLSANTIMEEKQRLWPRIVEEDAVIVFEHDPHVAAVTLGQSDGKYKARSIVDLSPSDCD